MRAPALLLAFALGASLPALAPAPAGAQQRQQQRRQQDDVRSRVDTTLALSRGGTVDLRISNGEIVVTRSTDNRVRVFATSERGDVRLVALADRITVDVESVRGRTGDARFEVAVPAGTRVVARGEAGDVSITGTRGIVEASSTRGDIVVADAAERIVLETLTGDIEGSRLTGDVRAESVSGSVELREVTGVVRIETTNGDIVLERCASRSVTIETVNGEMEFDGEIDPQGRYEFTSHAGDVRLHLPENPNATFSIETYSGDFESEFPVTLQPGQRQATQRPRRYEFTSGAGAARVHVETFNGDVFIERRIATGR